MANPRNKAIAAPVLGFEPPRELTPGDATALRAHETYEGELIADAELGEVDLTGASFIECELTGLTLTDAELRAVRFVDTLLAASFAPVLHAARTTWRSSRIENPRWGSAELFDAELDSVQIHGGKIDYLNLRNARLTNVLFENCTITELDLGGFRGNRVAFTNCRIETLEVAGANCSDVDLRTSDFSRVNGIAGLRGAAIDELQLSLFAPALAGHLGIRIA